MYLSYPSLVLLSIFTQSNETTVNIEPCSFILLDKLSLSSGKWLDILVFIITVTAEINLLQPFFIFSFHTAVASVQAGRSHEENVEEEADVEDVDELHVNHDGAGMYIWWLNWD